MCKKKKKGDPRDLVKRCPYCGSAVHLRSADGIYKENSRGVMLYVCAKYPACNVYVRVHEGTTIPVGTLANGELRALRNEAHRQFNRLYTDGHMTKQSAYDWLASVLSVPGSQAHIGYLGEYYCNLVITESQRMMSRPAPPVIPSNGGGMYAFNR